ncbi:hypothetical protein [Parerythrobacter aestuarii]|uniref:hypothetical protein n=1 Tax=Parerythrobacter aestuarii TaxID=3020909 RepID=UPI0024DEF957|nr:hypothetical protein [Parerythrobacter aestuarii]
MPDPQENEEGDVVFEDRRIARPDTALPDWYAPDAQYRPIPIAWFAGAFLLQMVVLFVIFIALASFNGFFTIAFSLMATVLIWIWTWERGMSGAGTGWRLATVIVLVLQLGLSVLGALPRV